MLQRGKTSTKVLQEFANRVVRAVWCDEMKLPSHHEISYWHHISAAISFFLIVTTLLSCLWWKKRKGRAPIDAEAQLGRKQKGTQKEGKKKKEKTTLENKKGENETKPVRKMTTARKMDAPPDETEPEDSIAFSIGERARKMSRRASESIRKVSTAAFQFEMFHNPEDVGNTSIPEQSTTISSAPARPVAAKPVVVDDTMKVDYGLDVGTLYFTLAYNESEEMVSLKVQKAIKLEAMDISGTSDPYIKVCLLPDKQQKLKTRIKKKNLNPVWNELFTFEGFTRDVLTKRTVFLQVYDHDTFSSDDHIGDVDVPLDKVDLTEQPTQYIKRIRPDKKLVADRKFRGQILISLCYDQRYGRLSVTVMKCRDLKPMEMSTTRTCDPYVKLIVLHKGRRVDKRKTTTKSKDQSPAWNETFEIELPINQARDYMLLFRVMDFDQVLRSQAIGEASVGYRTSGPAQKQWTDMLCQPKLPFTVWHTLGRIEKYEK